MNYHRLKPGLVIGLLFLQLCTCSTAQAKRNDKATVEPTELHFKEGMKKYKLNDFEGGADEFMQACYFARNKYNPEGWRYLGLCYKELKNWPKAIEAFQNHLSQTTEKSPDGHCDLAECYMNIGDNDKAEKEITQARIDSNFHEKRPFYVMGTLEEKLGDMGQALEAYNTALGDRPWKYTEAWMGRARVKIKMKPPRYNEALQDYKDIIEAALPRVDWVELYFNMAQCFYKRGDHQNAIDHLLQALKQNPDHFESHLALAKIFDEEKHITSSVNQYEHAIRCAPKGYDTDPINKRVIALQGALKGAEKDKEVKPTPYMRQVDQMQQQQEPPNQVPRGDSGF